MKITIRPSDKVFSQYIRKRDGRCVKCYSQVEFNAKDEPISHTNSHFFSRSAEITRFDPENCDCMCFGCHRYLGSNPEWYREWKKKQLGEDRYNALVLRAKIGRKKRDDKLDLMIAKQLLRSVVKSQSGEKHE